MEKAISIIKSLLEPGSVILILVILLFLNNWIFKKMKSVSSDRLIGKRTITFLLIFVGILVFILSLPIDKSLKGQILSFLGIVISAGIALSSTTILGNLIAGIMNKTMKRFRNGDLIKLGDMQGRVVRKNAFHTEIQLEDSNIVTIPNLYIASNPVKLTRKINTVVSASVSLGYDISRHKIEEALKEAAVAANLKDPYVYIMELGDYSVVYKIHGFLEDSSMYFSTVSLLNGKVMDVLHEKGIEIVSPSFMNQRNIDKTSFIPRKQVKKEPEKPNKSPEELIFDEAIEAEEIEKKKDYLKKLEDKKEELKEKLKNEKDEKETDQLKSSIERIEKLIEKIENIIREQND